MESCSNYNGFLKSEFFPELANAPVTKTTYHAPTGKPSSHTGTANHTTAVTHTAQIQGDFTYFNATRIDYADGTHADTAYDTSGNPVQITDRNGKIWTFSYNARDQVLTATNPAGETITYTYHDAPDDGTGGAYVTTQA